MSAAIKLPHGQIPVNGISEPAVREALMKVNDNIAKLLSSISELKNTVDAQAQGVKS